MTEAQYDELLAQIAMHHENQACTAPPPTIKDRVKQKLHDLHWSKPVRAIYYWSFYSWAYAPLQRFLHRRGWHHMTQAHLPDGVLHHCHWCGIRHLEPYWDSKLRIL